MATAQSFSGLDSYFMRQLINKNYIDLEKTNSNIIQIIMGMAAVETSGFTRLDENLYYTTVANAKAAGIDQINKLSNAEIKKLLKNPEAFANVAYGNRVDLGNTEEGDGYKYRGRGFFQITGKNNYIEIAKRLNMPEIIDNPDLLLNPTIAVDATIAFIEMNGGKNKFKTFNSALSVINPNESSKKRTERKKKFTQYALAPESGSKSFVNDKKRLINDPVLLKLERQKMKKFTKDEPPSKLDKQMKELDQPSKIDSFVDSLRQKQEDAKKSESVYGGAFSINEDGTITDNDAIDEQEADDVFILKNPKGRRTQEDTSDSGRGISLIGTAEASDKGIEGQMEDMMAGTKRVYDPGEDMVNTEDSQVAKMMRATDELNRSASKEDKLEGFRNRGDDVYIPGIEMEAFDDTKTIDEEDAKRGVGEPVDSTMDAKPSDSMDMFGSSEEDMRDDLSFFETLLSGLDIQDTASDFTESEEDREFRDEQMEPQVEPDAPEDEFQTEVPESEFPGDKLREGGEVKADFDGKEEENEDEGDPPPLAKPEEVADDIPALLSEGEYVLPANVVRYLGLERIMDMHRQVLSEIQQMEDLGMIQNVDKNGQPEDDDDEMKFAEGEEPEEGMTKGTIIIASSKPKGMMCPDPLMLSNGASIEVENTEEYGDQFYDSDREPEPTQEFDIPSEGRDDSMMSAGMDMFGSTQAEASGERRDPFTEKVYDAFGDVTFEKAASDTAQKIKESSDPFEGVNPKQQPEVKDLLEKFGNTFLNVGMQATGLTRAVKMAEAAHNAGMKLRENAHAEAIAEAEKARDKPFDRNDPKDVLEMENIKYQAWAIPGQSPLEDMYFYGGTAPREEGNIPGFTDEDYAKASTAYERAGGTSTNIGDTLKDFFGFTSKVDSIIKKSPNYYTLGSKTRPTVGIEGIMDAKDMRDIPDMKKNVSKFPEADKGLFDPRSSKVPGDDALGFPRPTPTDDGMEIKRALDEIYMKRFGMAEGGGIMVKKKFNVGGTYVPGVGYRETVNPSVKEGDLDSGLRSYDDIISGIYGVAGMTPDFELDKNPDKKRRSILGRQLPIGKTQRVPFKDRSIRGSPQDPYLKLDLINLGITTPEDQEEVLRDFAKGRSQLGNLSENQSARLSKELTNYSIAKRQQYEGFLEGDMAKLPEGATNRDALKTIFWKELSFDDTNRTDDVMEDPQRYGQYTAGGIGPIGIYGKPRRPMEAKDFKKQWLTPFSEEQRQSLDNSELGQLLDLDGPADLEKINRAQSYLTSEGNDRFINPNTSVPAGYIDNIFNEYRGFKGSPLRSDTESGSMSSTLMGKKYVSGVGYR